MEATHLGVLSLLPPGVLTEVVSRVAGTHALRSSCRSLRLAVHSCASSLTWSGPLDPLGVDGDVSGVGGGGFGGDGGAGAGGGAVVSLLQLGLPAAPPALRTLDCGGWTGREGGPSCVIQSLAGCPLSVQALSCCCTRVAELDPLAACTSLQTLDCSFTNVAELGPLAACTLLQTLDCSSTLVAELGPLAACMSLRSLHCNRTSVAELGPLAACTSLQTLGRSDTSVAELGPLAACMSLQCLICENTHVADLGPLAACTLPQHLVCCNTRVMELGPLAACTSLRDHTSHGQRPGLKRKKRKEKRLTTGMNYYLINDKLKG